MFKPIREVSRLWGDEGARLGALLQRDRRQSLAERWKHLTEKRPDIVAADFGYMPMLLEHQWAVISVPEDAVIYTVGLVYHFDHPELLIHSPELLTQEKLVPRFQAVLNQLSARVRAGKRFRDGQRVTAGGIELDFRDYTDEDFDQAPCGYLGGFGELFLDVFSETGSPLPVLWSSNRRATPRAGKAKKAKKTAVKKTKARTKRAR